MTPLPGALGGVELVSWRLEREIYAATWNVGEGAYLFGGRWSSPGRRVLYTSIDPATAVLEVAVHKGFVVLDSIAHTLLQLRIEASAVHVVELESIANPNWLCSGVVSPNQQKFGDTLLDRYSILALPSVVSRHSWNLIVDIPSAQGKFALIQQERFALDTRLSA